MIGFDVSLFSGLLPEALAVLALITLFITVARRGVNWWMLRVLPVVVVSLLVTTIANWWLDLRGRFDEIVPVQFIAYVAMPIAAGGLAACAWGRSRRWRRLVSLAAVPLTLVYAANLINQYYGYEPTIGALVGAPLDHQVSPLLLALRTADPSSIEARTTITTTATTTTPASLGGGGMSDSVEPQAPLVGTTPPTASSSTSAPQTRENPSRRPDWMAHGAISQINIPATVSHFSARASWVWVPPAFFEQPRPQLPVIVILAGTPGQPDNMIRAGRADKVAERYASAHGGVAPILVFADGNGSFTADTECVDSTRGNSETYLTKDVPAFISHAFSTLTGPTHWAIEGYSEGGTCALVLALAHPEVYGSFVDIAGDRFPNVGAHANSRAETIATLYGGNAALFDNHDPMLLMKRPAVKDVAGWFEAGSHDHRREETGAALDVACRQMGLQSRFVRSPGGHDFRLASHAILDSFAWLAGRVGV